MSEDACFGLERRYVGNKVLAKRVCTPDLGGSDRPSHASPPEEAASCSELPGVVVETIWELPFSENLMGEQHRC
jgi:hypothetical protein